MTKILLLVDDSRVSRMMIKTIVLQLHSDWQVIEAGDAKTALALTQDQTFDIAILHLSNSPINSLELAKKIMIKHAQSDYAVVMGDKQNSAGEEAKKLSFAVIEQPVSEKKIEAFLADC